MSMKNKLWCDLTTNEERSAWLLAGRGYETGVVSAAVQNDLSLAYAKLARYEAADAAPQPERKPLTDEQIDELQQQFTLHETVTRTWYGEDFQEAVNDGLGARKFARAIEAAHKIGKQK